MYSTGTKLRTSDLLFSLNSINPFKQAWNKMPFRTHFHCKSKLTLHERIWRENLSKKVKHQNETTLNQNSSPIFSCSTNRAVAVFLYKYFTSSHSIGIIIMIIRSTRIVKCLLSECFLSHLLSCDQPNHASKKAFLYLNY